MILLLGEGSFNMEERRFIVVQCGTVWDRHKVVFVNKEYTMYQHLDENFNVLEREQLVNSGEITDAAMNMLSSEVYRGRFYIVVKEL